MKDQGSIEQIVDGGYCIGCGACKVTGAKCSIELDKYGKFQARTGNGESDGDLDDALSVCPFSDQGPNEDELGEQLYGDSGLHNEGVGYYRQVFAGHVQEGEFRANGTSGGVISWVLVELLRLGEIDGVAHVKKVENPDDGVLFRYGISRTEQEIRDGAKSRYYPIEMSEILETIRNKPGRYAVVGLPCFIKAVRRLAVVDPVIADRVKYCVGLVCGHLKSKAFADYFGWQVGIAPGKLAEVDFRVKLDGRSAGDYGVYLKGGEEEVVKPTRDFLGSNWGQNLFRYSACDYCDDVFAETADISIGDAWLEKYMTDSGGTSVIVVRDTLLCKIIKDASRDGRLQFFDESVDTIVESQAGGLRDRREGLSYRLYRKVKKGTWAPQKRVAPSRKEITRGRQKIYENRSTMGEASHVLWHEAVENGKPEDFEKSLVPLTEEFEALYEREFAFKRAVSRFKLRCRRVIKYLLLGKN